MKLQVRASLALSIIALILAVTAGAVGGALANGVLIGSKQIRNGSVKSVDLKNNGVQSADVQNGTVSSADVKNDGIASSDLAPNSVEGEAIAPAIINAAKPPATTLPGLTATEQSEPGAVATGCSGSTSTTRNRSAA